MWHDENQRYEIFLSLNKKRRWIIFYSIAHAILVKGPVVGYNLCSLYLLRVELHILAYIVTDDCNTDKLRTEHWIKTVCCSEA